MATIAASEPVHEPAPVRRTAFRHPLLRRINHWTNVVAVVFMIMTGLTIFNAHPALYVGQYGSELDTPALAISGANGHGWVQIAGRRFDTTGVPGWSDGHQRAFPNWAKFPGEQDLATGRNWHLFFAWVLILNGIVYWLFSLARRHIQRDLLPTAGEIAPKNLLHDIKSHVTLHFPTGVDSNRYHVLQKLAYLSAVALFIPGMIVTGLAMSPGADAVAPWIVDLLGGRQTARLLHFACMSGLIGFIVVHVAAVLLAGVGNQLRAMITGRWAYDDDGRGPSGPPAPTTLAADSRAVDVRVAAR